ncbi:MAG: hypothetical protein OXI81_09070 [Paracoccaceae bacterium]|nr:hypothetical protein [Paracoccaceae bacterium]
MARTGVPGVDLCAMKRIRVLKLMDRDQEQMTSQASVHGQEPQAVRLSLNPEQPGERVLVVGRNLESARGMALGHRQNRHVLVFHDGEGVFRREAAPAFARCAPGVVLDRISRIETVVTQHSVPRAGRKPAFGIRQCPRSVNEIVQARRVEKDAHHRPAIRRFGRAHGG